VYRKVLQLLFEVFSIGLPRHAVDARRGVPFKREITLLQEIGGDVMQQCCEPYTLALSRRSAHGDEPVRRGVPAQCPGRGRLAAVPLGSVRSFVYEGSVKVDIPFLSASDTARP
jgi:hypothetical protein